MNLARGFTDEHLALAPKLCARIAAESADPAWNYLWCQILTLQVLGTMQPFAEYAALQEPDRAILDPRQSTATAFTAGPVDMKRICLLGRSKGCLFIGENARLSNVLINTEGAFGVIVLGPNTSLSDVVIQMAGHTALIITSGTSMPKGNILVQEQGTYILIGDDCMFSNNVSMRTSDSHGIYDRETRMRINPGKPIIVHNHVWVGRHVTMNKGTIVETDAVVGQGALTTGLLKGATIHAGHPAKALRSNIWWDRTTFDSMDHPAVVTPHKSRTRAWNHLHLLDRIKSLGTTPLDGSSTMDALSRILATDIDDAILNSHHAQVLSERGGDEANLLLEAHTLRKSASHRRNENSVSPEYEGATSEHPR
jgi:acetyltransferase-like isoleucine patch superfamily enzyme